MAGGMGIRGGIAHMCRVMFLHGLQIGIHAYVIGIHAYACVVFLHGLHTGIHV